MKRITIGDLRSAILITLTADVLNQENEPVLSDRQTNCDGLIRLVNERLALGIHLKTEVDMKQHPNSSMTSQRARRNATPEHNRILESYDCSITIKQRIEE
jgi:hypothetical protein